MSHFRNDSDCGGFETPNSYFVGNEVPIMDYISKPNTYQHVVIPFEKFDFPYLKVQLKYLEAFSIQRFSDKPHHINNVVFRGGCEETPTTIDDTTPSSVSLATTTTTTTPEPIPTCSDLKGVVIHQSSECGNTHDIDSNINKNGEFVSNNTDCYFAIGLKNVNPECFDLSSFGSIEFDVISTSEKSDLVASLWSHYENDETCQGTYNDNKPVPVVLSNSVKVGLPYNTVKHVAIPFKQFAMGQDGTPTRFERSFGVYISSIQGRETRFNNFVFKSNCSAQTSTTTIETTSSSPATTLVKTTDSTSLSTTSTSTTTTRTTTIFVSTTTTTTIPAAANQLTSTTTKSTVRPSPSPALKGVWEFCSANSECANGCCSKEYSDDKKFKCTPNGQQCTGIKPLAITTTTTVKKSPSPAAVALLKEWQFCTSSKQCLNKCCSKQYSNDGKYKCTPGSRICV
ncbi:hypothetical protein HK098_002174 [Nowakowskiella sp. JEL0407]|nr:hypothetical protein HK098_002174 [Nowakowskiella sp. JEL0407]